MKKGIQPALEQYLVTAGAGEGAAAAAASMDKRALLAGPGFAPTGAYIQILTTSASTTSCSSSLQGGAVAAGPLPSAPGAEHTAGSLYATPHGPSGRAALLQRPPAPGRGGGGPPVMPSRPHRARPRRGGVLAARAAWGALADLRATAAAPPARVCLDASAPLHVARRAGGRAGRRRGLGANHVPGSETFRGPPASPALSLPPPPHPSGARLPLSGVGRGHAPDGEGWGRE